MRRSAVLVLACLLGCGLQDQAQVECRCTAASDVRLFPQCAQAGATSSSRGGFNPLGTRIPECPSGKRLPLLEPTRPENVLTNVKIAFENLAPVPYLDQLTAGFLFVPDASDLLAHREVYNPSDAYVAGQDTLWAWEQERRYAVELLDDTRMQGVKFYRWYLSYEDERQPGDDRRHETFLFPYEVDFTGLPVNGQTPYYAIKGRMEVDLVTPTEDNPVWTIHEWRDYRDPSSAKWSWTDLRAEFSR